MKNSLLILLCVAILSCDKKENNQFHEVLNTKSISAEKVEAPELYMKENPNAPNFFEVETFKDPDVAKDKKITFPEDYTNAEFLNETTGTGEEIDNLIGNIVVKFSSDDGKFVYRDDKINFRKSTSNIKIRTEKDPIKYDEAFDSSYGQALNAFFANISNSDDFAYSLQLLKLSDVSINDNEIDLVKLKKVANNWSEDEKKGLYIIMGATNYYLKASKYKLSKSSGEINYAINVGAKRYVKTSIFSHTYQVAVHPVAVSKLLKLVQ